MNPESCNYFRGSYLFSIIGFILLLLDYTTFNGAIIREFFLFDYTYIGTRP